MTVGDNEGAQLRFRLQYASVCSEAVAPGCGVADQGLNPALLTQPDAATPGQNPQAGQHDAE